MAAPAEPRHSATVILVRPAAREGAARAGAGGNEPGGAGVGPLGMTRPTAVALDGGTPYEVFMVRRAATTAFAAGAFVFPGGTLRADDWPPAGPRPVGLTPEAADARLAGPAGAGLDSPAGSLALWITALRELFEEAGVLLAHDARGELVAFDEPAAAARFAPFRPALASGRLSVWDLAAREGLTLAPELLRYWAHWITPAAAKLRFNTRFFVAAMPPGQEALHCGGQTLPEVLACTAETTDGLWLTPGETLARHAAGDFPLVFATRTHLERLATFPTLEALWAHTEDKAVVTVLPWLDPDATPPRVIIPAEVRECW
jgi:8-oxo-dGTP pyrophosphatase MutT (NUDIX family)